MQKLDRFLDRLESADKPNDIQGIIEALQASYSVENVVYHALNLDTGPFAALTYTEDWMQHYHNRDYIHVDPVVKAATQQFHPLDWSRLDWSSRGSKAFLGEAIDAGVGTQGLSIPIRGRNGQFALFTINNSDSDAAWQKFVGENQRDMMLIAHHVHQKADDITSSQKAGIISRLSKREIDALTWLARGMTRAEAAEKMKISEGTFRVYVDTCRHKLGALNLPHAVAIAQSHTLILP